MITGINHITLAVTDIETSFDFYHNILGFKPLCKWNNGAYFLIGKDWFCLNVDNVNDLKANNSSGTHYAFTVSGDDFIALSQRIIQYGGTVYKDNISEGDSLYFLDPDGHKLEIHVGDWQSRINSKKNNLGSWQNVVWYI
jgi:catechol 2,3-dioxygenase-like lactoylglutathione lyase family enzyme